MGFIEEGVGLGASKSRRSIMFPLPTLVALFVLPPSKASKSSFAFDSSPFFLSFFFFFLSSSLESLDSPFLSSLELPPPIPAKRAFAFSSFLVSSFLGSGALVTGLGYPNVPPLGLFN
jgi:hypothetical protein